jgi:hypothetical protein
MSKVCFDLTDQCFSLQEEKLGVGQNFFWKVPTAKDAKKIVLGWSVFFW